jgi:hypothetical protein
MYIHDYLSMIAQLVGPFLDPVEMIRFRRVCKAWYDGLTRPEVLRSLTGIRILTLDQLIGWKKELEKRCPDAKLLFSLSKREEIIKVEYAPNHNQKVLEYFFNQSAETIRGSHQIESITAKHHNQRHALILTIDKESLPKSSEQLERLFFYRLRKWYGLQIFLAVQNHQVVSRTPSGEKPFVKPMLNLICFYNEPDIPLPYPELGGSGCPHTPIERLYTTTPELFADYWESVFNEQDVRINVERSIQDQERLLRQQHPPNKRRRVEVLEDTRKQALSKMRERLVRLQLIYSTPFDVDQWNGCPCRRCAPRKPIDSRYLEMWQDTHL